MWLDNWSTQDCRNIKYDVISISNWGWADTEMDRVELENDRAQSSHWFEWLCGGVKDKEGHALQLLED